MTQVDVCRKLLCTRFPELRLNRCHVAASTIDGAGNGVFASRDIEEGELITLYPGDALLIHDEKSSVVGVMFGSHIDANDKNTGRVTSHEARSYEMELDSYTSLVADPYLGTSNPSYLGHFANDGASLFEFDPASREAYSLASYARYNAANFALENAHMGMIATKVIPKGQEIFLSYGEGYWLSRSDSALVADKDGILLQVIEAKKSRPNKAKMDPTTSRSSLSPSQQKKTKKRNKPAKKSSAQGRSKNKKGFGV